MKIINKQTLIRKVEINFLIHTGLANDLIVGHNLKLYWSWFDFKIFLYKKFIFLC